MKIPIQNIYFLLCYAWNKLDEAEITNVDKIDFNNVVNLFGKVLANGCSHLFKRGLDRSYVSQTNDIYGVKGKLNVSSSVKKNLFHQGKTVCEFDEFDYNILHNQILKSTIHSLLKFRELDKTIRDELKIYFLRFHDVDLIKIQPHLFGKINLHRNNYYYGFLLNVCRIIFDNTLVKENNGQYTFKDFTRDEIKMRYLFQEFVKNFFKREQNEYKVSSEILKWQADAVLSGELNFLPNMNTDISLDTPKKKIIIDTKYYLEALHFNYDKEKIISNNLYQIFSYVKNAEPDFPEKTIEGILLYPATGQDLNLRYNILGNRISVNTINLNQDWREVTDSLLKIIEN